LGVINDAVHVWCNLTAGGETCIYPDYKSRMIIPQQWTKNSAEEPWFSDFNVGFKIKYIDEIQMSFMRMLYSKVTQKFTYFCINSVGYEEQQSGTKDYALDFMGENEYEWEGPKMKSKAVPFDGCKNRQSNSYTVYQLTSKKLNRLPIVDFKPKDYGATWQQFGFEIGPVCYS